MKPLNSSANSKAIDDHYVVIKNSSRINPLYEKPLIEVDTKPIEDVQKVVDECERVLNKINKHIDVQKHDKLPSSSENFKQENYKSIHLENNLNSVSSIHDSLQAKIQAVEKNLRKLLLGSIDKKIALRTQAKHLIVRLQTCITHSHNERTKQEIVISELRNMIDSITKDSSHIRIMKEFNDEIIRMTTIQNTRNAGKTTFLTWSNVGNRFNSISNSQNQHGLSNDHYANDEDNQLLMLRLHKLHKVKEQIVIHLTNYLEVKETHSLNYNNCNNVRNELIQLIRANNYITNSNNGNSSSSTNSNKRRQYDTNHEHDHDHEASILVSENQNNKMNCDNNHEKTLSNSNTSSSALVSVTVENTQNSNNNSIFSNVRKSLRTSKSYDNLSSSSGSLSLERQVAVMTSSSMDDTQADVTVSNSQASLLGVESYDHSRCRDCSFSHAIASDCIDHLSLLDSQTLDASRCLKKLVEIKEKVSEMNKLSGDTMIDISDIIITSSSTTQENLVPDHINNNEKHHINNNTNINNNIQKQNGLTTKLKNKLGSGIENIQHLNNKFAKLNPTVATIQSSLSTYLSTAHATASNSIGTLTVGVGSTVGNLSRNNSFGRLSSSNVQSALSPTSNSSPSSSPLKSSILSSITK